MLVRCSETFTRPLSPLGKKREAVIKNCWLSDSRVCVYMCIGRLPTLKCLVSYGPPTAYCNMIRKSTEVWQPASKDYSGTRRRSCSLSPPPSISPWPRSFCSLKCLAKLGPNYSCTSKLSKSQSTSWLFSTIFPCSLVFSVMWKILQF